jgi:cellulose synthase/poly-beta-1,6-N-acetylglucosamine synthase-like glycosyltransferase
MVEFLFWFSAALVFYVYAGYPLLLAAAVRIFERPVRKAGVTPPVSLLVAAYNEAGVIRAKVENALALDYPKDKLEIVIASDGSADGTASIAREAIRARLAESRARVLDYPKNRGKIAVLNDSVPQLRGEIVAFSDASSMLAPDALRRLMEHFADPEVGAASGVYKVRKKDHAELGRQEDLYWKYETFLKLQEARLGSILGCHGSLYAVRKELYPFPGPQTINDDYIIPVRILQKGFRISYEPASVAYEEAREMGGFGRRVRIMTGNVEQLREIKPLLLPVRPLALFFFLSHKAGRLVVPLAMLAIAACNLALLEQPFYRLTGALQAFFYLLVPLGAALPLRPKLLRLPYYFCMINAAAFLGIYHTLTGKRRLAWKKA